MLNGVLLRSDSYRGKTRKRASEVVTSCYVDTIPVNCPGGGAVINVPD